MEDHVVEKQKFDAGYDDYSKLTIVKSELINTIDALDKHTKFNIVAFATGLKLDITGFDFSGGYSVVMLVKLDQLSGFRRVLEFKNREGDIIWKDRAAVDVEAARDLLEGRFFGRRREKSFDNPVLRRFDYLSHRYGLRPSVTVVFL